MSEREKLEKWAWALLEEKNTLGESLLRYALAWKDDLDRAAIAQPPQTSESTLDFKSISLDALASFRCTQDPASYAKDHWSNRLLAILAEEKVNKPAEHPGCDRCNHPLYAGTHCKNCGKVHGPSEPWQPISTAPRIQGTELFVKSDYGSLHP